MRWTSVEMIALLPSSMEIPDLACASSSSLCAVVRYRQSLPSPVASSRRACRSESSIRWLDRVAKSAGGATSSPLSSSAATLASVSVMTSSSPSLAVPSATSISLSSSSSPKTSLMVLGWDTGPQSWWSSISTPPTLS